MTQMLLFTLPSPGVWLCLLLSFIFGWQTKKHLTEMKEYSVGCMCFFAVFGVIFFGALAIGVFIVLYTLTTASLLSLVVDVLIIFLGIYARGSYEKKHVVMY